LNVDAFRMFRSLAPLFTGSRRAKLALRVRPETSGRIAEFSEHEAD
jgi:hypothetical protein